MKKFHIGYINSLAVVPLLVCRHLGWLRQRNLDLVLSQQVGWKSLAERFFEGELDGGIMPPSMLMSAAANSRTAESNPRACFAMGYGGDALLGRAPYAEFIDSCIEKGEVRFGTFEPDFPDSFVFERWMHCSGLASKGVKLIKVPIPVTQSVLMINEGFIDVYTSFQPWIRIGQKQGIAEALTGVEVIGTSEVARILTVKNRFLEDNVGFYDEMSEMLASAGSWISDPVNGKELCNILKEQDWELGDEEMLELFHPKEEEIGGNVCCFKRLSTGGARLSIDDVNSFWRHHCASEPSLLRGEEDSLPSWVLDIFRVSQEQASSP